MLGIALGVAFGTAVAVGVARRIRRRMWMRHGGRGRRALRWIGRRLGTTPAQDEVIRSGLDEARRAADGVRAEMVRGRSIYAKALRGEAFDEASVESALASQQAALDELKRVIRGSMASVHATLDPAQRARLADLVEFGPRRCHRRSASAA